MRRSKLDLVVIYGKPVRYSVFVLRVWKYPTPNANKQYIWTLISWRCGVGGSSVGITTNYVVDGPGIESGGGARFFRTHPDRPWVPPTIPYIGYWVILRVNWPGRSVNHPPQSSAEVKEKVELYLYSPSAPSWPVLGWNLLFLPDVSKHCVLSEEPIPVWKNHKL